MFMPSPRLELRGKEKSETGGNWHVSLSSLTLLIVPRRVAVWLSAILLLLLAAHAVALLMLYGFGHDYVYGFVPLFNIAIEGNVPTYFASMLLLVNGLLFAALAFTGGWTARQRRIWLLLATVFCFLSLDEFATIHEKLIEPVRAMMNAGGYLYFAWVVPYAIAVAVLAFITLPFLWRIGGRFRLLFGLAGAAYLGGAIGVEMLGGRYFEAVEETIDLRYRLFQTVEETFEFIGLIILVYTLLELLRATSPVTRIQLRFGRSAPSSRPSAPPRPFRSQ